mgnify:CR=1 FL=1
MRLPIRLIDGKIPTRAHPTDSGLDLFAASGAVIHPGMTCRIRTGIAVAIPEGFEGQVRPRSSLASRGVYALLGTIDQGYRGEIGVILTNISTERYQVHEGDRVAQLVVCPVALPVPVVVSILDDTERGQGGFGSTGQ